MRKLKLGFALEGNSDYPVIPRLAQRLIQEYADDIILSEPTALRPRKRGHGFISELSSLAKQMQAESVDILIAVVDTDNTLIGDRRKLLQEAKDRCRQTGITICIADGLAVRQLEAWLLADEKAIFTVFDGERAAIKLPNPEKEADAKGTLNKIVRTLTDGREVDYTSYATELADSIRLQLLRQRCSHFDDFAKRLLDCVKQWQQAVPPL
ncbi:MAG: DUF4276 family protein [Acidobacteria bacterium]|nr:DUF4276 family protein [Acidobacteriota bacterium]